MSRRKQAWRSRLDYAIRTRRAPSDILDGPVLFVTNSVPSVDLEIWCRRIARVSGQRVDWGWSCGAAKIHVATTSDVERARRALWATVAFHDAAYAREHEAIMGHCRSPEQLAAGCAEQLRGIHAYNRENYGSVETAAA